MLQTRLKDFILTAICSFLATIFHLAFWRERRSMGAPRRILVLKPCCLGDVLMTTPLLAALRRGYPQASITYAVGAWSRPALEGNPNVDDFVDCGPVGSGHSSLGAYMALARELRRGRFDLAITLERSPSIGLLPFLAGIPQRVGLDSGGRGFAHTVRVPVDWRHPRHEAELYLDCARALGLPVHEPRLEFFPSAADRAWAADFLTSQFASSTSPLVALHPGGAANPGMTLLAKRWPPERFAAIADHLVERHHAHIVIVGAASDAGAAEAVRKAMRHTPVLLVGKTSLGQLAALYERCMLMLGNDSGVMHLAVAVGTPVVAVFGPSDPRVYGPYGPRGIAVRHDANCFGRCFAPGRGIALRCDRKCIEGVTVEEVWQAVEKLLAATGGGS